MFTDTEARALAAGAVIATFVPRGSLTEGDEVEIAGGRPEPDAPVVARFEEHQTGLMPDGYTAVVVSVDPAAVLPRGDGPDLCVYDQQGDGDLIVLRVFRPDGPVIDDMAFRAMQQHVDGAVRR